MQLVVGPLNKAGHDAYCPLFDPVTIRLQEKQATKEIFEYAFQNITNCDGMVAIISSVRKSEGQLMEIGANLALAKPLYLFVNISVANNPTHLQKLATGVYFWSTSQDLSYKLASIKFSYV